MSYREAKTLKWRALCVMIVAKNCLYSLHWSYLECFSDHFSLHSTVYSSVAQLCLTLCQPHGLQHARLTCPSPTPGAYSSLCPSSQWCNPTISFSVVPFSCLQSFQASGSFPVSQFFASGGKSIGVSVSASGLPVNIQDWFSLGFTGIISHSKSLLQHHSSKASILRHSAFFKSPAFTSTHDYWKNHSFN